MKLAISIEDPTYIYSFYSSQKELKWVALERDGYNYHERAVQIVVSRNRLSKG